MRSARAGDAGDVITDRRRSWPARRRLALGLSPMPGPGVALLLLGIALGPHGLGLVTESVLLALDPAVSVALGALGVLIGLDVAVRKPREGRFLAASIVLAATTIVIVGAGMLLVVRWSAGAESTAWFLSALLGLCAVSSSTAADADGDPRGRAALRIGNLGDLLPVLLSIVVLGATHQGPPAITAVLVAKSALIALTIAVAAFLLVIQTSSDSEQRVFVFGALLLLGGAAAHLSLSALSAGLIAGLFWNAIGPSASEAIARDVRYLQDPLIVLLLVVAGARMPLSDDVALLVAAYVVFRIVGRLLAAWVVSKTVMRGTPVDLGFHLVAPGAVGIAIVLNVLQANADLAAARTAFAVVVLGSLISEVPALIVPKPDVEE